MDLPIAGRAIAIYDDVEAVARAAAELFVAEAQAARARGVFTVALSGGSTPRHFHTLLSASPYREQVEWSQVQFYWGDERTVGPDDPESNFGMARETLLSKLPITSNQVHRIPAEGSDHAAAAAAYEDELRRNFHLSMAQYPRFDLMYLGMGPDGHTLSLFPHTAALHVTDLLVVANEVPKLNTWRITLTTRVANNARVVAFLVAGADKAEALSAVLEGERNSEQYPSQLIAPTNGELRFLVDRAAAAYLKNV